MPFTARPYQTSVISIEHPAPPAGSLPMHAVFCRTHLNLVTSELRYIVAHVCIWLKASTPRHAQPPTQRVPGFSPHPRHTHRPRREADHSLHLLPTINAWLSTSTTHLDEVVHKWVQEHNHNSALAHKCILHIFGNRLCLFPSHLFHFCHYKQHCTKPNCITNIPAHYFSL
jgi:hypothetical protein